MFRVRSDEENVFSSSNPMIKPTRGLGGTRRALGNVTNTKADKGGMGGKKRTFGQDLTNKQPSNVIGTHTKGFGNVSKPQTKVLMKQQTKPTMEIEAVEQAFGAIGSDILPAYDGGINLNILRETFEGGTRASLPEYMLKAEKFDDDLLASVDLDDFSDSEDEE